MTRPAGIRSERRLLLIEPPFYRLYGGDYALVRHPLSLAYLAQAAVENTDWQVKVFNADFAPWSEPFDITYLTGAGFAHFRDSLEDPAADIWRSIRAVLADYRPTVVGISVKSSTLEAAGRIAWLAKELDPQTVVVVGGPHPSATAGEMLADPAIDACVCGEGETTLVELLRALERGAPLERLPGLFVRRGGDRIGTPRREPLKDLDALGFPSRHVAETLMGYADYPMQAFGFLMATRGCPMSCLFCGSREVWGRGVRFRAPQHVAQEIGLPRDMGVESFHFDDDTFGVNSAYLAALCHALESAAPGISWSCEIHVKLVNEKNIALMKRAGCRSVQLGIESGDNGILKKIRKGFTIDEALAAGRLITSQGLGLQAFFMAGFPWETEETLWQTHEVIERIACEKVIYSIFTPYPGTEAFDLCRSLGLIPARHSPSLFGHQSPLNCFSMNLAPARFRELSREIEETVARKNRDARAGRPPGPR